MGKIGALAWTGSLVLVGCSTDGDPAAGGGGSAASSTSAITQEELDAVLTMATKDCDAMARCLPRTFETTFADAAACVERTSHFWAGQMFGPDSGATLESAAQCGAELDFTSCDAWWAFNYGAGAGACYRTGLSHCEDLRIVTWGSGPDVCFPKGLRQPGDPCGSRTQCSSGICTHDQSPGHACGTCAAASEDAGDRCGDGVECAGALACGGHVGCSGCGDFTCAPVGGYFQTCGNCLPHLTCFNGICHERKEEGESCQALAPFWKDTCAPDLLCDDEEGICRPLTSAAVGERCGEVEPNRAVRCELGAACQLSEQPDVATCVPRIPLGQACGTGYLFGSGCEPPGDCVAGTCQLRGPELCP